MSNSPIRRRPARSVPAIICAVLLLGAASAAIWAAVTALAGDARVLDAALGATTAPWSSPQALVAAILTAVAGLLLVAMALVPGRYDAHLIEHDGTASAALRNRGLETLLTGVAGTIDGVDSASATLRNRRADVRITTYVQERGALRETVTRTLHRRIDTLGLARPPRVSVSVSTHRN